LIASGTKQQNQCAFNDVRPCAQASNVVRVLSLPRASLLPFNHTGSDILKNGDYAPHIFRVGARCHFARADEKKNITVRWRRTVPDVRGYFDIGKAEGERWSRNFGPLVKVGRMTKEMIQDEETKEPFVPLPCS